MRFPLQNAIKKMRNLSERKGPEKLYLVDQSATACLAAFKAIAILLIFSTMSRDLSSELRGIWESFANCGKKIGGLLAATCNAAVVGA
jgi:hypothetical protein